MLACSLIGGLASVSAGQTSTGRPPAEARVPSFAGPSGLLLAPTAGVQRGGEASVWIAGRDRVSGGVVVGVANRAELGVVAGDRDGRTRVDIHAKLLVLTEQLVTPGLAIGIVNAAGSGLGDCSGYLVAGKTIIPYFVQAAGGPEHIAVKLTAGFGDGLFHRRPFGGVEFVHSSGVSAIGELVSGCVNVGVRYVQGPWAATAGWIGDQGVVSVSGVVRW